MAVDWRAPALDVVGASGSRARGEGEVLARAALGLLVACGALLAYGLAGARPPLAPFNEARQPPWLRGPVAELGLGIGLGEIGFVCLLATMLALYVVVVLRADVLPARAAVGAVALLHLAFALGPPVVQTDIFGYLMYARLGVLHDLVPYLHVANDVRYDPVGWNMGWKHFPSPYGPLFTLSTYALVPLPVAAAIGVLKFGAAGASLGAVALTWSCARRLGRPALPAAIFVGLNPLLLVWGVGAAHNDMFMLVLVLVGVRLALAGREGLAGASVMAAAAVKTVSGLVLPFMLVGAERRGRVLLGALLMAIVSAVVSLAAFGLDGVGGMLSTLFAQGRLISGHSVPNDLFRIFGADGLPRGMRPAFPVILAVAVVLLLRRTWRGGDWVTNAGWATLALLLTLTFLMPWYVVWLLPLAALADTDRLRWATLALTAFLVVGRVIVLLT